MSKRRCTRREFAKGLAVLAAAPLAVAPATAAQPAAETFTSAAEALTAVVRLRHGKHLTEEQLKRIRQRIESSLRSGALLRRPALRNADEPDFVFSATVV